MMRAPPFIRRWLEAHARKRSRIRPLGREDELVNEHNRRQRAARARPVTTATTTQGEHK